MPYVVPKQQSYQVNDLTNVAAVENIVSQVPPWHVDHGYTGSGIRLIGMDGERKTIQQGYYLVCGNNTLRVIDPDDYQAQYHEIP